MAFPSRSGSRCLSVELPLGNGTHVVEGTIHGALQLGDSSTIRVASHGIIDNVNNILVANASKKKNAVISKILHLERAKGEGGGSLRDAAAAAITVSMLDSQLAAAESGKLLPVVTVTAIACDNPVSIVVLLSSIVYKCLAVVAEGTIAHGVQRPGGRVAHVLPQGRGIVSQSLSLIPFRERHHSQPVQCFVLECKETERNIPGEYQQWEPRRSHRAREPCRRHLEWYQRS